MKSVNCDKVNMGTVLNWINTGGLQMHEYMVSAGAMMGVAMKYELNIKELYYVIKGY